MASDFTSSDIASLIASAVSLAFAAMTFVLVHVRVAKVSAHLASWVELRTDRTGDVDAVLSAGFVNRAYPTGVVTGTLVTLHRCGSPRPPLELVWDEFKRYDDKEDEWATTEMAHPIPVPGKGAAQENIWFTWERKKQKRFEFETGEYELIFWWRQGSSQRSQKLTRRFLLSAGDRRDILKGRKKDDPRLTPIRLEEVSPAG
jgi:hypothetical protein